MKKQIPAKVGEDITAPLAVASDGRIPIRSERAATVARWFGLGGRAGESGIGVRVSGIGSEGKSGIEARGSGVGSMREHDRFSSSDPNSETRNPNPDLSHPNGDTRNAKRDLSHPNPETRAPIPDPLLPPGEIALIVGPSGAGKSTLLRQLRAGVGDSRPWIDLASMSAPDVPLVDCFGDVPLRNVLLLLARVGLGEAWTYLRVPSELSEGQRWRLKLALALHAAQTFAATSGATTAETPAETTAATPSLHAAETLVATSAPKSAAPSAPTSIATSIVTPAARSATSAWRSAPPPAQSPIIACDEFAAVLDRVTAMVVSRCLRRAIDANPRIAAVLATSHDDLQPALRPDVLAWCDFGLVEWRNLTRD